MRRKTRPRSQLKPLDSSLAEVLGADKMEVLTALSAIRRGWAAAVGQMLSARTEPVDLRKLEDGSFALLIAVDHSVMAQQIRFLRDDIRTACHRLARVGPISDIRSKIMAGAGMAVSRKEKPQAVRVMLQQKKRLARELAHVKDKNLRRVMFRARVAQLAYADEQAGERSSPHGSRQ